MPPCTMIVWCPLITGHSDGSPLLLQMPIIPSFIQIFTAVLRVAEKEQGAGMDPTLKKLTGRAKGWFLCLNGTSTR